MRTVGVAEAARLLEVSEQTVRNWSDSGLLETERTPKGHRRFTTEAIEELSIRLGLGQTARAQRTIILIGKGLEDVAASLEAAGLHVQPADGIIDGLRAAQHRGVPIVIVSVKAAVEDLYLLKAMLGDLMLLVVARYAPDVPMELESHVVVCEPTELRRLVQWCWGSVKKRNDAVTLEL